MARGDWQPGQYERFRAQRAQPFWDLTALLDTSAPIGRAVDLGCGTGKLTADLAERLAVDEMIGVDNSPNMLAEAASAVSERVRFEDGDIAGWTAAGEYDLVFSNAALQWAPDHPAVLERWVAALRPGGQIAVQVPSNSDHASHRASIHVARQEPFLSALDDDPPPDPVEMNVLDPEEYLALLVDFGIREPHVRLQVYPHEMPSSASVVEWTKGTSLTRFFKRLPDELHETFVDAYRDELLARIGHHQPYLFTFKRVLMWGRTTA